MLYTEEYTDRIRDILKKGCLPEFTRPEHRDYDRMQKCFIDKPRGTCSSYDVPKKVHLSWIGSHLPDRYVPYVKSFVEHNFPNYEINLWLSHGLTQEQDRELANVNKRNIQELDLVHKDKILSDKNFSRANDILSYEIVFLFGGVYCDIDTECLKPLDENFSKSVVSHLESGYCNVQHAFFAFPKHSEFLEYLIGCVDPCYNIPYPNSVGPAFITTGFYAFDDRNIRLIHQKYIGSDGSNHSAVYLHHKLHANWTK